MECLKKKKKSTVFSRFEMNGKRSHPSWRHKKEEKRIPFPGLNSFFSVSVSEYFMTGRKRLKPRRKIKRGINEAKRSGKEPFFYIFDRKAVKKLDQMAERRKKKRR